MCETRGHILQLLAVIVWLLLLAPQEGRVYGCHSQSCSHSQHDSFSTATWCKLTGLEMHVIAAHNLPMRTVLPSALPTWKNSVGSTPLPVIISLSLTVYLPAGNLSTWSAASRTIIKIHQTTLSLHAVNVACTEDLRQACFRYHSLLSLSRLTPGLRASISVLVMLRFSIMS